MNKKIQLRQHFRQLRQQMSTSERREKSKKIRNTIKKFLGHLPSSVEKMSIALFYGMDEEVSIYELLEEFPEKNFCFPRITNVDTGEMDFFSVSSFSQFQKGNFGILEPSTSCRYVDIEKIAVVCVPLVSIDANGNRIGMGGGFYDRFLAKLKEKNPDAIIVGVYFFCQQSEKIFETEEFDIPVSYGVCENGWKNFLQEV